MSCSRSGTRPTSWKLRCVCAGCVCACARVCVLCVLGVCARVCVLGVLGVCARVCVLGVLGVCRRGLCGAPQPCWVRVRACMSAPLSLSSVVSIVALVGVQMDKEVNSLKAAMEQSKNDTVK